MPLAAGWYNIPMPSATDYFFSSRLAYPWSEYPLGTPALIVVALLLIALTVWTYLGHPNASRGRVLIVLVLRLLALAVALLTAIRPSIGIQEQPRVPSTLLVGIDLSESMTVKDEFNNLSRIDAVRKVLERCQPTLNELRDEQNVNVQFYRFGPPDFNEATFRYEPTSPADGKRSDYGTYLNRMHDRWLGERFLRGHLVIGDGADNGSAFSALAEARKWSRINCPITTFVVGTPSPAQQARDLAAVALSCDPSPAAIKNDVAIKAIVNAYGFQGAPVKVKAFFDDVEVVADTVTLHKEKDNEVVLNTKAPDKPGEVRVRFEVEVLPGEVSELNNVIETYLTVTKEGMRVLIVDTLRWEETRLRDALAPVRLMVDGKEVIRKTFDLVEVIRQTDMPPSPAEQLYLDLDQQAYDVMVIGNVTAQQLTTVRPDMLQLIADRVTKKGMGLILLGGERAFGGSPDAPGTGDWAGTPIADILPVQFTRGDGIVEAKGGRGYQTIPTRRAINQYLMRIGNSTETSVQLWNELNGPSGQPPFPRSRITGYNRFKPKPGTATVFAWASQEFQAVDPLKATNEQFGDGDSLLVGHQIGDGNRGRVLAFAGFDTYLWERLGQPKTRQGVEIHHKFWRQVIRWLAHQEEDEGLVYARPEFRRLAVGTKQTVKVGIRSPDGVELKNGEFDVRVVAPGEAENAAVRRPVIADPLGGARLPYEPMVPGEYVVIVKAKAKDAAGKDISGEARARFIAYPDVSDEMLRTASDADFMARIASAAGGRGLRLDDLPNVLKELKGQALDTVKPKPRYLPDWRRNHSQGFLPAWLIVFAVLLGIEWGLRRVWGMM